MLTSNFVFASPCEMSEMQNLSIPLNLFKVGCHTQLRFGESTNLKARERVGMRNSE